MTAKFSDPVFNEFPQIEELGSTMSSIGATKQEQWDIELSLLKAFEHKPNLFYIPVRIYIEACSALKVLVYYLLFVTNVYCFPFCLD